MSPSLSWAMLGSQRFVEVSGAKVPVWLSTQPLPLSRSSAQRTPATLRPVTSTEWLITIDSKVPKFRYIARYMVNWPTESSFSPGFGCGMQARLKRQNSESYSGALTCGIDTKVELPGEVQLT